MLEDTEEEINRNILNKIPSSMTDLRLHQTALPEIPIDIAIYIPARNEENEDRLTKTIASLRRNAHVSKLSIGIIVVNDGSTDHTGKIAKHLADYVVTLPDRGYSALGLPELADTHNAGLKNIQLNYPDAKYIMVSGADTIYHEDYLRQVFDVMENNGEVVICGGQMQEGVKSAPRSVRGSGRFYSQKIMRLLEFELPHFYAWESYPLYLAQTIGYKTFAIDTASYTSLREPYQLIKWRNYDRGVVCDYSMVSHMPTRLHV